MGRSAITWFSRGCPHTCTFCSQWMFWKRWRHRDPVKFADELEMLYRDHGIQFAWMADENPTTSHRLWKQALEEVARRRLPIKLSATMRAQDIVRDADILPLYKQAGFIYILLGVETVTDEVMAHIGKDSNVDEAYQAVRLLRQHNIMSIIDYIVGFEQETPATLWRSLRGLWRFDADMVNVLYLLPHAWSALGRALKDVPKIQPDLSKWDFRHQILPVKRLGPTRLFLCVKLMELLYHIHPRSLHRILFAQDPLMRKQMRWCARRAPVWYMLEVLEHFASRFRLHA